VRRAGWRVHSPLAENAAGRIHFARGCSFGSPGRRAAPFVADGGLIGGASLKPDDFMAIINAANQE
jgi:hypothetical protein